MNTCIEEILEKDYVTYEDLDKLIAMGAAVNQDFQYFSDENINLYIVKLAGTNDEYYLKVKEY